MKPVKKKPTYPRRESRKVLEEKIISKSKRIIAEAKKKPKEERTEEEMELEEAIQETEAPKKKKRVPPTAFKKKLEETAWVETKEIATLDPATQRAIQDEDYWKTHWQEIDQLIQEDVNALDLTLEQRVALAKKRKNKMGRPTKLNEVVTRKLKEAFEQDCTIVEACRRAKIWTNTYYQWKERDPDFRYEMDFYEEYLKNISLGTVSKWARVNAHIAMEVAKARDDRYKPKLAELPQIQLIQINTWVINIQNLQQTERANVEVYEPEEVRARRKSKFQKSTT